MATIQLDLGETELATLVDILNGHKAQQLAWIGALHSTDAEREEAKRQAQICDIIVKQIQE